MLSQQVVVCHVVVFHLSWSLRVIVVGGRECNAFSGCLGTRGGGGGLEDWGVMAAVGGVIVRDLGRM